MRFVLLAALLGLAAPALAQDEVPAMPPRTLPDALEDLRLATSVQLALSSDPRTRRFDVDVDARDGVVAVAGVEDSVYQPFAAAVVREVSGVRVIQGLGEAGRLAFVPDSLRQTPPTDEDLPAQRVEIQEEPGGERAPATRPAPEPPRVHVVRRGDTLYGIARQYGTTLDALVDLNRLSSTNIRIGQRLRLR